MNILRSFFWDDGFLIWLYFIFVHHSFQYLRFFPNQRKETVKDSTETATENPISNSNLDTHGFFSNSQQTPRILRQNQHFTAKYTFCLFLLLFR
jgi:hypothetical protein